MSEAAILNDGFKGSGRPSNIPRVRAAMLTAAVLSAAAALSGCASGPEPTAQLMRASTLVSEAEKNQAQRFAAAVLIEGNTDSAGSPDYNEKLSAARAHAVAQGLELRGVPQNQYQTIGLGEAYPIASNSTEAGRQQNRRVDIVFSNASGRFSEAALSRQGAIRR